MSAPVLPILAICLALAACGPAGAPERAAGPAKPESRPATGYVAPPQLEGVGRTAGGLVLRGSAPVRAQVRLASPEGQVLTALTGADGRWSITAPPSADAALFALSAEVDGRTVRGEGAVLTLPEPGPPALLVRAGFAALPLGQPSRRPEITAVDYDAGGGAAVGGFAQPMGGVRLSVDGVAAGLSQADAAGRFAVLASNRPLAAGTRRLQVETDTGRSEVEVQVSRPSPLGRQAYRAVRQAGGWRVDWSPAGGGVQTTVVFDRAPPAAGVDR